MRAVTNSIFHFTSSFDVLKIIITKGFRPSYCLEFIQRKKKVKNTYEALVVPMVSFCDIPLSRIDEHNIRYGKYGVGLTKSWAKKNKIFPVSYVERSFRHSGMLRRTIFNKIKNEEIGGGFKNDYYFQMAMSKPMSGMYFSKDAGFCDNGEFYSEREWRYIPDFTDIENFIYWDMFTKSYKRQNNYKVLKPLRRNLLKFHGSDIKYLILNDEKERTKMIRFLRSKFRKLPGLDLLISNIFTHQQISEDF